MSVGCRASAREGQAISIRRWKMIAARPPMLPVALQFEAINQLPPEEQAIVKEVLESLIIKYQTRRWDLSRSSARPTAPGKKAATVKRTAHAAR